MSGHQTRPGVSVGRGVVRLCPLPPGVPQPYGDGRGQNSAGTPAGQGLWRPLRGLSGRRRETSPDRRRAAEPSPDPGSGEGPRPGVCDPVDAQDADVAAAGVDDPVFDQDFDQKVAEPFHEAYMAHTSTSPNYQILASLDLGRRQVALEGVELVQRQIENAMQLRDAIDNHPLLSRYMACLRTSDLIPDEFRPSGIAQPLRSGLRNMMAAWDSDEFVLDPSRITLSIGRTGYDGDTFKREQLMDRHGVQINKTSRNTVLFMTNIGTP